MKFGVAFRKLAYDYAITPKPKDWHRQLAVPRHG
jgi:hypothetical protein